MVQKGAGKRRALGDVCRVVAFQLSEEALHSEHFLLVLRKTSVYHFVDGLHGIGGGGLVHSRNYLLLLKRQLLQGLEIICLSI